MTAIDSDIGFDAIFRKSAAELKERLASDADAYPRQARHYGAVAGVSIFAGLGILSVCIFTTGYSALQSDSPEVWIHRLMALALLQSIVIGAVAMKLMPIIERGGETKPTYTPGTQHPSLAEVRMERTPPPLPEPPAPVVGGQLAGREFLEYKDGSIEIDTMVGRRRFVSLDAAREFVGS
jgi:hypothetical protein